MQILATKLNSNLKIGLALSGGGVLTAAHIGLIEELEKHQIRPDLVVGTSSGAMVGALYAYGGSSLLNQVVDRLIAIFATRDGYLKASTGRLLKVMEAELGKALPADFAALQIPFIAVCTKVKDGSALLVREGNLMQALLTSSSYPGIFPAQKIGQDYAFDGGLVGNFPAKLTRDQGMDFVIGSGVRSLSPIKEEQAEKLSRVNQVIRALEISMAHQTETQVHYCDMAFRANDLHDYRWYQVKNMAKIREIGRANAKALMPELLEKLQKASMAVQ